MSVDSVYNVPIHEWLGSESQEKELGALDGVIEKLEQIERRLDLIFGEYVLINGKWVHTGGLV